MEPAVGIELTKLLLQVIYADDVVSPVEREALLGAAARLGGEAASALVLGVVDRGDRPPPPNMGLLATHRGEVLLEVARLGASDGIHRDELDLVAIIGEMLR